MNRGLKIFTGILVFFGVLSLIFLLTAKNKSQTASTNKSATVKKVPAQNAAQAKLQANKALIRGQWQKCKTKTMTAGTTLLWNVQISEAIPQGGTYAKGTLDNDSAFLVHVTVKSGGQFADKIKPLLVAGKMANLRGTCTDVASDGAVVLEAF